MIVGLSKKMETSGQVTPLRAHLLGFLVGTDGVNDPRFSIHNGTANTDEEKVPSTTFDASALGANGAMFTFRTPCADGIYFNEEAGANYECIVYYQPY
jgi:hypothetical protein